MSLAEFTELLRCPQTRQKLTIAPPELLNQLRSAQVDGRLFNQSGKPIADPLEAVLVREDGNMCYPVRDGIPALVRDEAIPLSKTA